MANRSLLARVRRDARHRNMVVGYLTNRCPSGIFNDYLYDNHLKGEPMLQIGKCYYVETVTKYWTGRITAIDCDWIELEDASWIPDTGRFNEFVASGSATEVEPIRSGLKQYIPINCVTAVTEWPHPLPREVV